MWKIVGRLEVAFDWIKNSRYGTIVAIVGIILLGFIIGLISSNPTLGFWSAMFLIIVFLALFFFVLRE